MKTLALLILTLAPLTTNGQQPAADQNRDSIKRNVETFLYAENRDEVTRVVDPQARIFSVKTDESKITITPLSKPAGKPPKGSTTRVPRQTIVSIDMFEDGAVVKVETDRMTIEGPTKDQIHVQYISLMRIRGEWRIVSILMPSLAPGQ